MGALLISGKIPGDPRHFPCAPAIARENCQAIAIIANCDALLPTTTAQKAARNVSSAWAR